MTTDFKGLAIRRNEAIKHLSAEFLKIHAICLYLYEVKAQRDSGRSDRNPCEVRAEIRHNAIAVQARMSALSKTIRPEMVDLGLTAYYEERRERAVQDRMDSRRRIQDQHQAQTDKESNIDIS